ncbi:MAG: hypothetical protein F2587_03200 [Actinobacteria bacterium]|jgi:hypothetical protein|uniref:Unannotated protein n=1 Tax=freshwater metagenome TaxID=449393 RepID=A0A6J6H7W2_9ZZZZ|nr:hypothetical protein [Actinomycetota bacterium]
MKITMQIAVILHLIGIGALLSGFFYQLKDWGTGMKVNAGILHGAWLMLVTGFALAALVPMVEETEQINNWVLGAKSIVITVIFFIAYGYNKKEKTDKWVVPAIAGLTVLNICLAVLGPIMIDKA